MCEPCHKKRNALRRSPHVEMDGERNQPLPMDLEGTDMTETNLSANDLVLSHDYAEAGHAYWATFLKDVVTRGLPHERYLQWSTATTSLDDVLEYATQSSKLGWGSAVRLDLECGAGCVAVVSLTAGRVMTQLAAETIGGLDRGEAFLRERFPALEPTDSQTVPIAFWSYGCHGPTQMSRAIDVPTWSDIRGNYPSRVRDQLEKLMDPDYRPDGRGQLILWYGEPGTGKTYSLRALGWQWREWCEFHYVTDPETFFGRPDYMLQVILEDEYR